MEVGRIGLQERPQPLLWVADRAGRDSDGVPRMFVGTPHSRPSEVSYALQEEGIGAVAANDGRRLFIGKTLSTNTFNGDIAFLAMADSNLSVAELLTHWPRIKRSPTVDWLFNLNFGLHMGTVVLDYGTSRFAVLTVGTPTWSA